MKSYQLLKFSKNLPRISPLTPKSYSTKSVEAAVENIFLLRNFSSANNGALEKELQIYSSKKQTPVSLKSLMETGTGDRLQHFEGYIKSQQEKFNQAQVSQRVLIQVACFLHRELPIRLAQRAVKLEASPLFVRSGKPIFFHL